MPIMRVSEPTYDERKAGNRVFVRFRVNRQPDESWIETFRGHAASSVLRAAHAVFKGNDAMLELARSKRLAELSTALDCFIECANLGLRSWGSGARSPEPARGRVRA